MYNIKQTAQYSVKHILAVVITVLVSLPSVKVINDYKRLIVQYNFKFTSHHYNVLKPIRLFGSDNQNVLQLNETETPY